MRKEATVKAIVTGHSKGLGDALAEALLARGAAVLGLARSRRREAPGLTQVALDLSDPAGLQAWLAGGMLGDFLAGAERTLLINNAGLLRPMGPVGGHEPARIVQAVAVNVTAPLLLTNAFIAASGALADRRVLHLSSGAARTPYAGWSLYCATKAALDHHARSVSLDGLPGLRISSVAPGVVDTDMQAEIRASSEADFPLLPRFIALKEKGELAAPADCARHLVELLLSEGFGRDPAPDLRHL